MSLKYFILYMIIPALLGVISTIITINKIDILKNPHKSFFSVIGLSLIIVSIYLIILHIIGINHAS